MTSQLRSTRIGGRPGKLPAPRTMLLAGAMLAVLGTVLLSGCGSIPASGSAAAGATSAGTSAGGTSGSGTVSSSSATPSPSPSPSASDLAAAKVDLTVTFVGKGDTGLGSWTLRCDPPGGTLHDPAAACATITASPHLLFPIPVRAICPMIMVDAATANVTGTYFGKKVHEQIVDGGCDIARWNEIKKIFG
jgi:hypothetical protein